MSKKARVPLSLEDAFWSKVWRCHHRGQCKRCCWPWKSIDCTLNWKCIWEYHALFIHKDLARKHAIATHRLAYELPHGSLTLGSVAFPMCHQCNFAPCCNPSHSLPGSISDNVKDKYRNVHSRTIVLPDGRHWAYAEACASQYAFYEALQGQRVWAGAVPTLLRHREPFFSTDYLARWLSTHSLHAIRRIPRDPMTLGRRLTLFRELEGVSQQALAEKACVPLSAISLTERNQQAHMTLEVGQRLARALGITFASLLGPEQHEDRATLG